MTTIMHRLILIICVVLVLLFQFQSTSGYVPSTHKSQWLFKQSHSVNLPEIIIAPTTEPEQLRLPVVEASSTIREEKPVVVRLAPVLETNPLTQQQQQQPPQQQQEPQQDTSAVTERKQTIFVTSSAALAGFTDVLCLAQYNCFVNMCTGNMLKMTSAIANVQTQEALVHALFVLSYAVGVTLFAQLKRMATKSGDANANANTNINTNHNQNAPLCWVAPLVALIFATADLSLSILLAAQQQSSSAASIMSVAARKTLQVPFLAMGFGVINSAAAHATGATIFFAMTGHLTKLTNYWVHEHESLTGSDKKQAAGKWQPMDAVTAKSWLILKSFLSGALCAALLLRRAAAAGSSSSSSGKVLLGLPLCTSLGLLYASLFAWYAPLNMKVPLQIRCFNNNNNNNNNNIWWQSKSKLAAKTKTRVQNVARRVRQHAMGMFGQNNQQQQQPALIPIPVLVDDNMIMYGGGQNASAF